MTREEAFRALKITQDQETDWQERWTEAWFEHRNNLLRQTIVPQLGARKARHFWQLHQVAEALEHPVAPQAEPMELALPTFQEALRIFDLSEEGTALAFLRQYEQQLMQEKLLLSQAVEPGKLALITRNLCVVQVAYFVTFDRLFGSAAQEEDVKAAEQVDSGQLILGLGKLKLQDHPLSAVNTKADWANHFQEQDEQAVALIRKEAARVRKMVGLLEKKPLSFTGRP